MLRQATGSGEFGSMSDADVVEESGRRIAAVGLIGFVELVRRSS